MRWVCCAVITLSACYSPSFAGGAPCDLTTNSCPTGQTCVAASSGGGVCMSDRGGAPDAGGDSMAAGDGGGACLGNKLLGSLCLTSPPTGPVSLTAGTPINTATVATGGCTEIHPQAGGPSLCIIAGTTIDVPAGVTLRAFAVNQAGTTATATNPLVLVATRSITIEGTIDAASHLKETLAGGIAVFGAGARTAVGCPVSGLDGQPGKPDGSNGSFGGGGGAGGSFGSLGGAGGFGGNNSDIGHGNPMAGTIPSLLVGGCPGGSGGNGDGGMGGGAGGSGGGAIYLLAGTSITISGKINASGAGGVEGGPGMFSSGGGGGGGSGGLIGLEAPTVTIMAGAAVYANGGGGASGSGQKMIDSGSPGADPTGPTTAAGGGPGNDGGGAGGAGSTGTAAGGPGSKGGGNNVLPECAGGGGGGGGGVIHVFSTQAATIMGAVSPPPR